MVTARTAVAEPITSGTERLAAEGSLQGLLQGLYREQLALDPHNPYLLEHGRPITIANQVRTFQWYRSYLRESDAVLDWGCHHAPDSCLLRAWYGDRLSLFSCDFEERDRYPVFHDFARTDHVRLDDHIALPYPSNFFDAIVASGVLEHTAMDYESLKELYRVLKPDGVLLISYLPNWLSVGELLRRKRKQVHHRRLYGMSETKQLLKRSGFYPVAEGYHTYFWERMLAAAGLGRFQSRLAPLVATLLPVQVFASTLYFAARKVQAM